MSVLDELTALRPKEEYLRLKGVELVVPTEDQLDKARATSLKNGTNLPAPRASIKLTWEPLSYNMRGVNGNTVDQYIAVSFGLEPEDLARVRTNGWLGIPDRKLIRVDEKVDALTQDREWPRFRLLTKDIMHLDIDVDGSITGKVGQPYSTSVGHVFKCTEGSDAFARNEQNPITKQWSKNFKDPRKAYMRYPIELDNSYVAPADVPIRIPRDTSSEAGAVLTEAMATGITSDVLRKAVVASGMVGMKATDFASATKQISFVATHMEDSDETLVFGTGEVSEAANEGELVGYLKSKGAVEVTDEGVLA